jgi:flavin-dependent dehydrogenase
MWMVQRDRFDDFLGQQAIAVGATIQDNSEVTQIKFIQDHWQVKLNGFYFGSPI